MRVRLNSAWKEVTGGRIRVGTSWKNLTRAIVYVGGAWKDADVFTPPLSVSANDVFAAGFTSTLTTNTATASVTGGIAPYTYAWALVANGGGTVSTANSPSAISTTFTKTGVPAGTDYTDTWKVTVTDSLGSTAEDTISATFSNVS